MSLLPLDLDLELFASDALELLSGVDSSSDSAVPLLGAEEVDKDADLDALSELLEAVDAERAPVLSSDNAVESEDTGVASVDLDGGNTTEASAASTPSPAFSNELSAQASASSEANAGPSSQGQRMQRRALGSRRLRNRKKNELGKLREEAATLADELERLRANRKMMRANKSVAEWEDRAIAQKHKRYQAEQLNFQLKHAVFEQRGLVAGLRGCLSSSPLLDSELNLHHILHTYIHLGTHPRARLRSFQSICTESRLDLARRVIERETKNVPFDAPNISTRQLQAPSTECGLTTVAVYAFETTDVNKIFSDLCQAIVGNRVEKPDHTMTSMRAEVADEPSPQVRYSISDGVYTSDITGEEFRIASRIISFYRVTDEYALLLWDYVDVDDLNPVWHSTHIKADVVGAVVVRRETCVDGVERVVCRYLCTKLHRLSHFTVTSSLERFLVSGGQICTRRVYEQIKENNASRQTSVIYS